MYGEINMKPEIEGYAPKRKPRIEVVRWATSEREGTILEVSTKTVVQQDVRIGELEQALADVRKERDAVYTTLEQTEKVLAEAREKLKPVDPDLLAVRELCARDVLDFAYKAKIDARRDTYVQMARDVRAGLLDHKPLVQDALRVYKAGKAAR